MASSWIEKRMVGGGSTRNRVHYRLGGAESVPKLAGTFRTLREARARRGVLRELAVMRVPDLGKLAAHTSTPTLVTIAEEWRSSRVDVADGTAATHK